MTVHIEWASAADTHFALVKPEDYEYEFGMESDIDEAHTLVMGSDPAFAVQGTITELRDMLYRALKAVDPTDQISVVSAADPSYPGIIVKVANDEVVLVEKLENQGYAVRVWDNEASNEEPIFTYEFVANAE